MRSKFFFMITKNNKIKLVVIVLVLAISPFFAFGQEGTPKNTKATRAKKVIQEKAGRPDVPGDLMIEFGFNWMQENTPGYGFKTIGSNTFNMYYLLDMPIGDSKFSFHPGIGFGTDRFSFDKDITLGYGLDSLGNSEVQYVPLDSIYGAGNSYKKSIVNANYLDIPFEIRWHSRQYDPKRSFKVAVGGKVGVLIDSKTKIKYKDGGETKKTKQKENFNLSTIRYGAYAKVGFGGFSLLYYYSISDAFKKDKGPMNTTTYPMTIGMSLALF